MSAVKPTGIIYWKRAAEIEGDSTKNCSLLGEDIDNNFYFLRCNDLKEVDVETVLVSGETKDKLVFTKYDGSKLEAILTLESHAEEKIAALETKLNNEISARTTAETAMRATIETLSGLVETLSATVESLDARVEELEAQKKVANIVSDLLDGWGQQIELKRYNNGIEITDPSYAGDIDKIKIKFASDAIFISDIQE